MPASQIVLILLLLGTITISIGVARLGSEDTPASLIRRADSCLYQAKRYGRNRVVHEDEPADVEINVA